jgi:hypothetical protein
VSAWLTGLRETVEQLPEFVRVAAQAGVREVYLQRLCSSRRMPSARHARIRHCTSNCHERPNSNHWDVAGSTVVAAGAFGGTQVAHDVAIRIKNADVRNGGVRQMLLPARLPQQASGVKADAAA